MTKEKNMPIRRKTHTINATGQALGRLATRIATILRGKNKVTFQPYIDGGDYVVVSNVSAMKITGAKLEQKKYYHYSGYPGGMKTTQLSKLMVQNPADVLRRAVTQMLPSNRLRKSMMKRLSIS